MNLNAQKKIRPPLDTVGFATNNWQMDSIVKMIHHTYGRLFDDLERNKTVKESDTFKIAICPHDDYAYAGYLYEIVLPHVKAKNVILIGVAHKAKKFNIESTMVFDSFDAWKEPYGDVKISPLRNLILDKLPKSSCIVHDSLHLAEHSLEALVPFLQYYNERVQIVPVLIPYMSFEQMEKYAMQFASVINQVMKENNMKWGKDVAIVISNDAVHYGDQDWGGKNYAEFGCDSAGYKLAFNKEKELVNMILPKYPDTAQIHKFFNNLVKPGDWREYQWPWCGRYSVPFGLLTGLYLTDIYKDESLIGTELAYSTSIENPPLNLS